MKNCKNEKDCNGLYVDLEEQLCLSPDLNQCPSNKKYITKFKDSKNKDKYMCSNSCNYSEYTKSTPYNTCVKNCEDEGLQISNESNEQNRFGSDCFCGNLFYINDSIKVACFDTNINSCKKASIPYRININGTNECVQTCNGSQVLSLMEDTCYPENHDCGNNETIIIKNNGQRQCDCKHRFYYINDTDSLDNRTVKYCMSKNQRCHDVGKTKFVPETLECVDKCPDEFKYEFQNYFCLRLCPKDSALKDNNICECEEPKKYWHKISSKTFECLDICHDRYPVYAPDNNRCLITCKNSYFPYFHENKCYRSCDNSSNLNIINAVLQPICRP